MLLLALIVFSARRNIKPFDPAELRVQLHTEECDNVFRKCLGFLRELYGTFAQSMKPGEGANECVWGVCSHARECSPQCIYTAKYLTVEEFTILLTEGRVFNEDTTDREARMAFIWSVADSMDEERSSRQVRHGRVNRWYIYTRLILPLVLETHEIPRVSRGSCSDCRHCYDA
jgi:hypothetical protein